MKDNITVSYFPNFGISPKEERCAEFAANGVKSIVLDAEILEPSIFEERSVTQFALLGKKYGMIFNDCHALSGNGWDLNTKDSDIREKLIVLHILCMKYASKAGVKTFTMHIGVPDGDAIAERERVSDTINRLLPAAEKFKIIIALENSEAVNAGPDDLLYYVEHFNSPFLGLCYDCGHANIYEHTFGKNNGSILEAMFPQITTAHLHDNNGEFDAHLLPGEGNVDWPWILYRLRQAPKLVSIQNEVLLHGKILPVRTEVENFNSLLEKYFTGKKYKETQTEEVLK